MTFTRRASDQRRIAILFRSASLLLNITCNKLKKTSIGLEELFFITQNHQIAKYFDQSIASATALLIAESI